FGDARALRSEIQPTIPFRSAEARPSNSATDPGGHRDQTAKGSIPVFQEAHGEIRSTPLAVSPGRLSESPCSRRSCAASLSRAPPAGDVRVNFWSTLPERASLQ